MSNTPGEGDAVLVSYKPGAFFYRNAIRGAKTKKQLEEIALSLCLEYQDLREWCRDKAGVVPPKWRVTEEEAKAKGWKID